MSQNQLINIIKFKLKIRIKPKMAIKSVQVSVLLEDTKNIVNTKLEAYHGLSFLVTATTNEDNKVTVLMDTGPSPDALLNNADILGVNLQAVDSIVLSHGHYDHTGGLIKILKHIEKRVPVIGHPTLFNPKLKIMPSLKFIGSSFNMSNVESAGGIPLLATNPIKIAGGITTTGEVPRLTTFEDISGFWTIKNTTFQEDVMVDDQSLIIDVESKGLVVVSGCAHSGIINTIKHAQKITQNHRIYAVLGGFHLASSDDYKIKSTVAELKYFDPEVISPCHCTGKKAIKAISEVFKSRCNQLHTGDITKL
jgi:7,8-dihydropterin-6-yl-methyl-4-(beta-D-ribofuranosyl)aminobenzene 5'-phosphate synthase